MRFLITYLIGILTFTALLSCTSSVDFDQLDTIELNQNFTASFIYFDVNQTHFLSNNASAEISTLSDVSIVDIFDSKYVQDNLVKADFNFEIINTFNRDFEVELSFLNADNNSTTDFVINVPNNSTFNHLQSFEGFDLTSLKRSQKIRTTINLRPSSDLSILDKDEEMNLTLKSSVNFFLKAN